MKIYSLFTYDSVFHFEYYRLYKGYWISFFFVLVHSDHDIFFSVYIYISYKMESLHIIIIVFARKFWNVSCDWCCSCIQDKSSLITEDLYFSLTLKMIIKKTLPIVPDVISVPFTEGDVNKVFQTPLMIGDDGLFLSEFIYKDMVCDHIFF